MVAASDFPFRHFLKKKCGVDLVYTQMLHAKNFVGDGSFRKGHLDLLETGTTYPKLIQSQLNCLGDLPSPSSPTEEEASAPLMVQLAGDEVDLVLEAANMLMDHTNGRVSGFDLNCGW
jgi:tRNA-dihydrouridine synthase